MSETFTSFTSKWHQDIYPSIDATRRPELSLSGKTVVITGGGRGIGAGMANAFAAAGAASIILLGRTAGSLSSTKESVEAAHRGVKVSTHSVDVVDLASVKTVAAAIGGWDVLVLNAGYLSAPALLTESEPGEWWKGFEINVKGTYNMLRELLPRRREKAAVIGISAGSIQMGGRFVVANTSYNSSKFGALKLLEIVAEEYPDVHVVSLHPGVVATDMMRASGMSPDPAHIDTVELPSNFAVWLCSEEARFLRGKFVWTNWDVDELKAKKENIEGGLLLTANIVGYPYPFPVGGS